MEEGALEAFYRELDEHLESKGWAWAAKGQQAISKATALEASQALLSRRAGASDWPRDVFDALRDVLREGEQEEAEQLGAVKSEPDWRP